MKNVTSFAPANISCIFVIKKTKKPETSGSLGLGFTVNKGVFVTIKKISIKNKKFNNKNFKIKNEIRLNENNYNYKVINKNIVFYNNKKIKLPTVNSVIEKLTDEKFIVNIRSELPLGCGFGISGASALATAYALNKLLNLKIPQKRLAFIAHVAEVENKTGLGDVTNQYYGGFLIKYKPSYTFNVKRLKIINKKIFYRYISNIDTKRIISNNRLKNVINNSGNKALNSIKKLNNKHLTLKNLINISKEFSYNSELLKNKKIINLIKKIENKGGNASMIMLGNALFSDTYFKGCKELIIKDKCAYIL